MELFALDAELDLLEAAIAPLQDHARLELLPTLAWHLRQRDGQRALALADEAQALLATSVSDEVTQQLAHARLALVRGEIAWLSAELDQALAFCHQGQAVYYRHRDALGQADAHMLEAQIAADRGHTLPAEAHWSACAHAAMLAREPVRVGMAKVAKARSQLLRNIQRAESPARLAPLEGSEELHPCLVAVHKEYLGLSAALRGDFAESTAHYIASQEAASYTGQLRLCIEATSLLGRAYAKLNDHEASLDWMKRALSMARVHPWPWSLGVCLMHFGETLRNFGRQQAASELLHEALQTLTPLSSSRPYSWTLMFLAKLEHDMGALESSLQHFRELGQRAVSLNHSELSFDAQVGEAEALSLLNQPKDALRLALRVLDDTRGHANVMRQIEILTVLANMHTRHRLPVPEGMQDPNPSLHYLNQAASLMAQITGYTPPPELLEQVAQEYAKVHDHQRAYDYARRAAEARAKIHGHAATDRAIAMQVHHQNERARVEMAYHRQLGHAESKRAQALEQTSQTLERLGQIGRDITAKLELEALFDTLHRHAQATLPVDSFSIYMLQPDGQHLSTVFVMEGGERLAVELIPLNDPYAGSARCVRERRELVTHFQPQVHDPSLVAGTLQTLSRLYTPLKVDDRILAVMSVQSAQAHAYGEREQTIFRTLCAYGAIALDNAQAYERLKQARAKLLAQDKLAMLGSLVAGVAQALNSPLGNSVLIAETLQHRAQDLSDKLQNRALRKADLAWFADESQKASSLLVNGLEHAARLVQSFTQLARQGPTEARQVFDLHTVAQQLLRTLQERLSAAHVHLHLRIPEGLMLDGYPDALMQVLTQLMDNVLRHAYPPLASGAAPGPAQQVRLSARPAAQLPGHIVVELQDKGMGMPPATMRQLFKPFFTQLPGGDAAEPQQQAAAVDAAPLNLSQAGGRGLGLFLCHNIITGQWGGSISASSKPGEGSLFTLTLPMQVMESPS